jgi:hypothetical protein
MNYNKRTPEQIQADRDARKERFIRLKAAFEALSDSQRSALASLVVYTCDGHQISPVNTALVNFQRPDASIIGGFHQWRKNGRHVRKGEKAISIWIPLIKANASSNTDEVSTDEQINFRLQSVFDISQTDETKPGTVDHSDPFDGVNELEAEGVS